MGNHATPPHHPSGAMSKEQLKAFLEKVKTDTSLQEKLKAAASPEAAIEIAKEAGFSITSEDIQSMQSEVRELSDEELEGAAGGTAAILIPMTGKLIGIGITALP